jgi:transcriptional regulator with XRE-family HTH domain
MSNLGDMIKQKREALEMGQAAVSGLLGLGGKRAQATISQYENNVRPVVLDDYSALAKFLGLPVDEVKAIAAKDVRAHKAALKRRKDKREGKCRDLPRITPAAPSKSKPGVLESLIAVYPKPASTDTKVLLAWYNAISTLHGALGKAAS